MPSHSDTIILIPARLASTRLPNKPLANIAGKPMIIHVMDRAKEADIGDIAVCCAEQEIANAVEKSGGKAILTDPAHPSGTDRIYEALTQIDPNKRYKYIVNVQGDLPTLDPHLIQEALALLSNPEVDISTLVAEIIQEEERINPNVVKAVLALKISKKHGRALYFTRCTAPYGQGVHYHHIGLYAYTRDGLERFVSLPPSPLEEREKLEQLRALEDGMRIDAAIVNTVPLGVDTEADLEKARQALTS